ncbi:MAG: CDP-glycerol glycerophosphotransferase family protein [Marinicella sp.]
MKFIRYFKDVLKFNQLNTAENQICIYCEGANYWPHLKPIVESLLQQPELVINYVSSSEADPALLIKQENFKTYVIGEGFIRNYFFDNLASKIVIMTMPDLDQYQIKKSTKVGAFVYIHHSLVSHHMVYRPKAFDAFDVIFCAGPHHNAELKEMQKYFNMPPKKMINHGYGRLDSIMSKQQRSTVNTRKKVLLAPSWGPNGIIELMGEQIINELMKLPYEVILRPHPQTLKFAKNIINRIVNTHQNNQLFSLEVGVSSAQSLHQSDLMISDWSGAALDYAFGLLKPVLFIDVPKKVQNPDYESLPIEPFESSIRSQVGLVQSMDLTGLADNISALLSAQDEWTEQLKALRTQHVYNLGTSGHQAAKAILELL